MLSYIPSGLGPKHSNSCVQNTGYIKLGVNREIPSFLKENPKTGDFRLIITHKSHFTHEVGHVLLFLKGFGLIWAIKNNLTQKQYEGLAWSVAAKFSKYIDVEFMQHVLYKYELYGGSCKAYLSPHDLSCLKKEGIIDD